MRDREMPGVPDQIPDAAILGLETRRAASLLQASAYMARELAQAADWRACLPNLLARLGEAAEVQRCYLFVVTWRGGEPVSQTCLADWAADGLHTLSIDPRNIDEPLAIEDPILADWVARRRRGEMIAGLTRDLDGYLRQDFEHQSIRSFLSVPILLDGKWWGHLGFDDCMQERGWSDAERTVIQAAAALIAGAESRFRAETSAATSRALNTAVVSNALDAVVVADAQGLITDFNPAAERLFGWSRADVLGRSMAETIVPLHHRARHEAGMERLARGGPRVILGQRVETEARRRGGDIVPVELTVTQAGTEESQAFAAHIRDISDRRRAARELEALAYEDPTTGFPNRAGLMRRIDPLSRFGAMVAIDLAGMGEIAATFGAGFANAVLRALALRLVNLLGEEGLLGRIGDKGIGLFLANGAHGGTGESHLERVRAMFAQPFAVDGRRLYLAARIGHAVLGDDNPEEALRNAELAMRLAKPGGEPVGYSAVLRDQRVRLLDREMALRAAASRPAQEFELHYQPLVCLDDGFLVGFEALLRWRHPKEGMIPPLDFIPLAEVTGLIVPIGSHVLQEAAAALARWSDFTARPLFVSVNLSPVQIAHGGIVETLGQTLHETGIDPTRLKLEITETAVMSNPAESLAVLGRMKSQGVTLALDGGLDALALEDEVGALHDGHGIAGDAALDGEELLLVGLRHCKVK